MGVVKLMQVKKTPRSCDMYNGAADIDAAETRAWCSIFFLKLGAFVSGQPIALFVQDKEALVRSPELQRCSFE